MRTNPSGRGTRLRSTLLATLSALCAGCTVSSEANLQAAEDEYHAFIASEVSLILANIATPLMSNHFNNSADCAVGVLFHRDYRHWKITGFPSGGTLEAEGTAELTMNGRRRPCQPADRSAGAPPVCMENARATVTWDQASLHIEGTANLVPNHVHARLGMVTDELRWTAHATIPTVVPSMGAHGWTLDIDVPNTCGGRSTRSWDLYAPWSSDDDGRGVWACDQERQSTAPSNLAAWSIQCEGEAPRPGRGTFELDTAFPQSGAPW